MHGIYCLCEQTAKVDRSHYNNSLSHHKLIRIIYFSLINFLNSLTDLIHVKSTTVTAIQILRITYVSSGSTHNS